MSIITGLSSEYSKDNQSQAILAGAVTRQGQTGFLFGICEGGVIKNKVYPGQYGKCTGDHRNHVTEVVSGKSEKQSVEGTLDSIDEDEFEDDDLSMAGIVLEDASIESFAQRKARAEEEARRS